MLCRDYLKWANCHFEEIHGFPCGYAHTMEEVRKYNFAEFEKIQ